MSPMLQARTWVPTGPVIEQAEAVWVSMVQSTPVRAGSGSLTVTAVAVPGPPLPTSTVKPTEVPAVTGVASAVLVIARLGSGRQFSVQSGGFATMVARAWTKPPLVDFFVAVLGTELLILSVLDALPILS